MPKARKVILHEVSPGNFEAYVEGQPSVFGSGATMLEALVRLCQDGLDIDVRCMSQELPLGETALTGYKVDKETGYYEATRPVPAWLL